MLYHYETVFCEQDIARARYEQAMCKAGAEGPTCILTTRAACFKGIVSSNLYRYHNLKVQIPRMTLSVCAMILNVSAISQTYLGSRPHHLLA
jgi:hypothetical protein